MGSDRVLYRGSVLFFASVLALVACQNNKPTKDVTEITKVALNASPQIGDFSVYAQNSATLQDRVAISGGDVGVKVAGTGPFLVSGYELALASEATVDSAHNVIANRVLLLDRAQVTDVQANQLTNQNAFYAHKYAFSSVMPALPGLAAVSPGTTNVTVAMSTTVVLAPGSYAVVSVGYRGVLRLQGGVYHMTSLQLGDETRIEALAPVQLRISGRLEALARVWIGPATGITLSAGDLRIEVSGRNGSTGALSASPKAAKVSNDSTLKAVMLVPNGTLELGHRMQLVGAFVGKDVEVGIDSQVTYQSGMGPAGCLPSCDDGNPCTVDTCVVGSCTHTPAAFGVSCSDGNACNGAETCDGAGQCQAGSPITCTASDQCHVVGVCDPATGLCSNPAAADGTSCNDGDSCTKADICTGGTCGGTTYTCNDGLACTGDSCNGDGTCTFVPTAGSCV